MKSLLIIDGSSLLTTSFFGNMPMAYKMAKTEAEYEKAKEKLLKIDGVYTNGVFAMMRTLLKIIRNQRPSHVAVAWDLSRNTFRRKLYPGYKANRPETRPELKSQFPLAQEVLKEMGIPQFVLDEYEADDIIGTFATNFKEKIPVNILTKDQDALQLVDERVRLWYITSKSEEMYKEVGLNIKDFHLPDGVFEFTPMYVEEFYGLRPEQIVDKKALEGDTSDNIPGVKGVGEKSVVPLLQEFGTVERIYEYLENTADADVKVMMKSLGIKQNPSAKLMKTSDDELVGKEAALLSKKLATIVKNIDEKEISGTTLDDLVLCINEEGKRKIFEQLAFKSLLDNSDSELKETA
ncbi:5'-3' exonuclease H3TH domain-containing protein [Brevibacillus sp. NPDC058079]|uniref:5'-3' exonuclease n=1 Tax=Brevibacillus sp. NPDC058079 TaxID=3346330 RepID=UPI0036E4D1F2